MEDYGSVKTLIFPNTKGYRTDVLNALKDLQVPVLRWPGDVLPMNITGWTALGPKRIVLKWSNNNWEEALLKIIVLARMNS